MHPKDKAKELIDKFLNQYINFLYIDTVDGRCIGSGYMTYNSAIQCALTEVDEIINTNPSLPILSESGNLYSDIQESKAYWQEVKNEILKLSNQKP